MATAVALDTWAFLEVALEKPRAPDVAALVDDVERAFTTREVVIETFSSLLHRTRSPDAAWGWWEDLRRSRVKVFEPALSDIHAFASTRDRGALSMVDLSLGHVALRERTKTIVTEDAEFRKLGLTPIFAK